MLPVHTSSPYTGAARERGGLFCVWSNFLLPNIASIPISCKVVMQKTRNSGYVFVMQVATGGLTIRDARGLLRLDSGRRVVDLGKTKNIINSFIFQTKENRKHGQTRKNC